MEREVIEVNRKILLTVLALSLVLLATPYVGTAAACGGQCKKEWKSYDVEGILLDITDSTTTQNGPILIIDGTRLPAGVVQMTATIDGVKYCYPEDFDYAETFHVEINVLDGTGTLTVWTVLTFHLPCHPALKEYIVANLVNGDFYGTFQLSGTKLFCKVEGGGPDVATHGPYDGQVALFPSHVGLIKGWPCGARLLLDLYRHWRYC
jgi:hypothetical protein